MSSYKERKSKSLMTDANLFVFCSLYSQTARSEDKMEVETSCSREASCTPSWKTKMKRLLRLWLRPCPSLEQETRAKTVTLIRIHTRWETATDLACVIGETVRYWSQEITQHFWAEENMIWKMRSPLTAQPAWRATLKTTKWSKTNLYFNLEIS